MFMDEIMKARGVNVAELYTDLYRKTNGYARIYFYCEQDEANIPRQMLHPRALYMDRRLWWRRAAIRTRPLTAPCPSSSAWPGKGGADAGGNRRQK